MKVSELLTEKISVSSIGTEMLRKLRTEFPKKLGDWYVQHAKSLPFYIYADDQDAHVSQEARLAAIDTIKPVVSYLVRTPLIAETRKLTHILTSQVEFQKLADSTAGHYDYSKHLIVINSKQLDALAKTAYDEMEQSFFDNNFEVYGRFDDSRMYGHLEEIVEIWVHELVHALQFSRSKIDMPYRSYLEKSRQKFHDLISDGIHDAAYLGSPEEIEAFAQEEAFNALLMVQGEDLENQLIFISDILTYLGDPQTNRYQSKFGDSKDPKEIKVKQRFLKKVYQELDARKDEVLAKLKAEKNKKNDE